MSLTSELIKLLGGAVKVKSAVDKGSEFFVWLPISNIAPSDLDAPTQHEIPIASQSQNEEEITSSTQKSLKGDLPRLLIVEDNPDIRQYLTVCLESRYQLSYAENGAIGITKALDEVPDIIISDVMMPEKDGFELCETLKEDIRTSHIPIVLLTAKSSVESRIVGLKHGADDYLAKPFHEEELLIRMKKPPGNSPQTPKTLPRSLCPFLFKSKTFQPYKRRCLHSTVKRGV